MSFQFVDNNDNSAATRKRIRSHVAQGKNVGRKINRPSRKKAAIPSTAPLFRVADAASVPAASSAGSAGRAGPADLSLVESSVASSDSDSCLEYGYGSTITVPRLVADGLVFPVAMSSETHDFARTAFHFLSGPRHTLEMARFLRVFSLNPTIWVRYMLMDEAYFHCTMATAFVIMNQHFASSNEQLAGAAQHLVSTFRIVNDRLSGRDAASDQTIATVVAMSQYELVQRQHHRGFVHLQGLERLVKLRGGIQKLTAYMPILTVKMFRADLEYALQLGSATIFSVEDVAQGSPCKSLQDLEESGETSCFNSSPESLPSDAVSLFSLTIADTTMRSRELCSNPGLQALLAEMKGVSSLLNDISSGRHAPINGIFFHNYIILLGYRLLAVRALRDTTFSMAYAENLIYLGLVSFLLTFLPRLDRKIPENNLLSGICHGAALFDTKTSRRNREVLLWFLFITGCSTFTLEKEPWLVRRTAQILGALGLESWAATSQILGQFPWVHELHGKHGLELWSKAEFQNVRSRDAAKLAHRSTVVEL